MPVTCQVCMNHCTLAEGQWGLCRARKNEAGEIVCKNYGRLTSISLDPIEKKPLRRFYPGSQILSVGSFGCNLRCPFCQNHEISMAGEEHDSRYVTPEELTELALDLRDRGNIGVAFTYNEPLISWEYVLDCAKLLKERKLQVVCVTNGTLAPEILDRLLPYVDAMNIDLKGFNQAYYERLGGSLKAVKDFIRAAVSHCHVELTTLIVPKENDAPEQMEEQAKWIASLGKEIPLHVSRFFPRYHMTDRAATEVSTVYRLAELARNYLTYVYEGNC